MYFDNEEFEDYIRPLKGGQSKRHYSETWMARWQRRTGVRPDEAAIKLRVRRPW